MKKNSLSLKLCVCVCVDVCVCLCVHIVDLSLGCSFADLIESLPWIGRHISKAWHGKGLLLSSHCFIYHPSVCVCLHVCVWVCVCVCMCVCVLEYHGFSQGYLWYGCMCVWKRSWSKFVRMWKHPQYIHTGIQDFGLSSASVFFVVYVIFIPQGQWWSQEQNSDEVCVYLHLCVCQSVCVCMFLQHKDSDVEKSCILINWSRREGLCVGRQIHTATTSHSPNLGHTHTHTHFWITDLTPESFSKCCRSCMTRHFERNIFCHQLLCCTYAVYLSVQSNSFFPLIIVTAI